MQIAVKKTDLQSLVLYILFFLVLFFKWPLNNELPGNTDTLLAISLSNIFMEKFRLFFSGQELFTSLYPAKDPLAYGENCYGLSLIFLSFKAVVRNEIWAYYLFITTLFSLTSFAIYKWASLYVENALWAFLAGFLVTLNAFTLGNIDDPNVIFLFFPALSFVFLTMAIRDQSAEYFHFGLMLSALQIWFGFYVFLFQMMSLVLFCLIHFKKLPTIPKRRALLTFLIPVTPLFILYYLNHLYADVYLASYDNPHILKVASLYWKDFWNVLPGNIFYSDLKNVKSEFGAGAWINIRKNAFPGFLFTVIFIIGLLKARKKDFFLYVMFFLFLFISFGSHLPFFDQLLKFPLGVYFRVPFRFYLFALMPASIFFAMGAEWLIRLSPKINGTFAVFMFVFYFCENVPMPLNGFALGTSLKTPQAYKDFFKTVPKRSIVLDLPTRSIYPSWAVDESKDVWFYNRDMLYMNWQTYHGQIIIGGVNGYLPNSRVDAEKVINQLPNEIALLELKKRGVEYIVFHKNLVLNSAEDIIEQLRTKLKIEFENAELVIMKMEIR